MPYSLAPGSGRDCRRCCHDPTPGCRSGRPCTSRYRRCIRHGHAPQALRTEYLGAPCFPSSNAAGNAGRRTTSSPEQLLGKAIDGHADQYALAATTHQLLTGTELFTVTNPVAAISQHLTETPPKLSTQRPELAPRRSTHPRTIQKTRPPLPRLHHLRQRPHRSNQHVTCSTEPHSDTPESVGAVA